MKKYKAIIFDLDGTLLNTIEDITDALNYACEKNGLNKITIEEAKSYTGNGVYFLIERLIRHHKDKPTYTKELYDNIMRDYMYVYNIWKYNHTKPYEGVVKSLNILKRRGIKLAVLSNKPHRDTTGVIEKFIPNMFDIVMGARDGVKPKPAPDMVYIILDELKEKYNIDKEDVMFIGDSEVDIETANNSGLFYLACLYGFRTKKELEKIGCTNFISSMREVVKMFDNDYDGVLLLNKPYGLTCQDCVSIVRSKLKIDRVGHCGTLDPLATGLLVILLGTATKMSNYLLSMDKEYISEITIGKETNTWDNEGNICLEKKVENNQFSEEFIDNLLSSLKGTIKLKPPIYSAIKVDGKKSYDLARSGKEIDLEERDAVIYEINRCSELNYHDDVLTFKFRIKVSKGTYIRSLCHHIGSLIGYPSYMTGLVRTESGELTLDDSSTIKDIENDTFKVLPVTSLLEKEKIVPVKESILRFIENGREIYLPNKVNTGDIIYLTYEDKLIAIYEKEESGKFKARRVWK